MIKTAYTPLLLFWKFPIIYYDEIITVKAHLMDTCLIRTPHYYRQFFVSLEKASPCIFSVAHSVFDIYLTGCDCIKRKYNDSIQKISSLWFYCLAYCYRYYFNRIMGLLINRGYYMAARRYEISLRVLKNISRVSTAHSWNIFSTREEKFLICKRPCNVLFII